MTLEITPFDRSGKIAKKFYRMPIVGIEPTARALPTELNRLLFRFYLLVSLGSIHALPLSYWKILPGGVRTRVLVLIMERIVLLCETIYVFRTKIL